MPRDSGGHGAEPKKNIGDIALKNDEDGQRCRGKKKGICSKGKRL